MNNPLTFTIGVIKHLEFRLARKIFAKTEFCEIFKNNFFFIEHFWWLLLGYLFQVFIPTVSYDYWLSKYFFYFGLSCNTCQCFLTLRNIYTKTPISIYRTHISIHRTHISIYRISCCNFVAYCNFVTRKNLWICIKWNYLILSTPDCDMK